MSVKESMTVHETTTLAEIVSSTAGIADFFEENGIDYFNSGDLPLTEACKERGLDPASTLERVRMHSRTSNDWRERSIQELTKHILDTHHAFTRTETTALTALSDRARDLFSSGRPELVEVHRLTALLERDLQQHMMKEEQILFPFVTSVESAIFTGDDPPQPFFGTVRNPIQMMLQEHDAAADILEELRRVTSGYSTDDDRGEDELVALYRRLHRLELDIHFHMHLENNIYFPRAIDLETRALR